MRRLREAGADAVKILLYYSPFDPDDVNDQKHAWVERIGDECRANDIPFFLEFVGYEEGDRREGPRVREEEAADRHGEHGGVHEGPLRRRRAEGRDSRQHEVRRGHEVVRPARRRTRATRRSAGSSSRRRSSTKPFIYLSAGVSNAEFTESLALAAESGVRYSGVLCGRATWKDGMPVYAKEGAAAFRRWLETKGVENIRNVNAAIKSASPWYSFYGASSAADLGVAAMAILKVARMGHPVLRTMAQPVPPDEITSPRIQRLIDDMFETMNEYAGIGLAAPQVHESLRIFVAGVRDADGSRDDDRRRRHAARRADQSRGRRSSASRRTKGWEGCLSIPDIRGLVPRAPEVARARARSRRARRSSSGAAACRRASSSTRTTTSTASCSSIA